jgi:hypothetical protein
MLFPAFCALWARLPFALPLVCGWLYDWLDVWLEGAEGSRSGKTGRLRSRRGASDMMGGAGVSGLLRGERMLLLECEVQVGCKCVGSQESLGARVLLQGRATIWTGATVVCALFVARHSGDKAWPRQASLPSLHTQQLASRFHRTPSLLRSCIAMHEAPRSLLRTRVNDFASSCSSVCASLLLSVCFTCESLAGAPQTAKCHDATPQRSQTPRGSEEAIPSYLYHASRF